VGLDRKAREGISGVEGEIHKRTSISNAGFRQKMRIEVDVSDYATKRVLSIEYEDGQWKPVAYLLKSLNESERNYKIYNKKMLVVIRELENWIHLLEDAEFKFEVWTDYKNILIHVPRTKIEKTDRLSRRLD